ncbi:hypothetical protein [Nocardioides sp.]|uniref:hypothetical protein n=1 Tax=Nocardioides sp. TaxID=35761 RepID=UPI00272679C6|nr:hypothetical protein [Nocardioides sp.]MDO9455518.1 hypothetical protein [Nocardioides sp.]
MTDDQQDQPDQHDELRALLQSADPAASLPTADPTRVARLLEDTMTDQLTDESRTDGTRNRSRLTWIVAAAAVLVIGGGVLFATTTDNDDDVPPTAGGDPTSQQSTATGADRTVTELSATGGTSAKCMDPLSSPQVVAAQTTAFDGTVESISGGTVTLVPTKFYAGDETDVVVVQAPGPDMEALLSAVSFEEGSRYLVSATDGQVTLCGFSAEYSDALAAVYAEAFPS